jgi:hypothetical protein
MVPNQVEGQQGAEVHVGVSNHNDMPEPAARGENAGADWKRPLMEYLAAPSNVTDQKICRQALKYTLLDGELYRRMVDGLLLKCQDVEQARVAMGEVHKGMCDAHSLPKKRNG